MIVQRSWLGQGLRLNGRRTPDWVKDHDSLLWLSQGSRPNVVLRHYNLGNSHIIFCHTE